MVRAAECAQDALSSGIVNAKVGMEVVELGAGGNPDAKHA